MLALAVSISVVNLLALIGISFCFMNRKEITVLKNAFLSLQRRVAGHHDEINAMFVDLEHVINVCHTRLNEIEANHGKP